MSQGGMRCPVNMGAEVSVSAMTQNHLKSPLKHTKLFNNDNVIRYNQVRQELILKSIIIIYATCLAKVPDMLQQAQRMVTLPNDS